jgi:CysZ protein
VTTTRGPAGSFFPVRAAAPGAVAAALLRAVPVFFSARLLALVLLPLAVAALAWLVVAWWAWDPLVRWLSHSIFSWSERVGGIAAATLAGLLLMLAAVLTALAAIAVLAMPVIVETVATRDFAALERRRGGTFAGSLRSALGTIALFIPLWIAALALLAFPPAYLATGMVLSAWLNQRLFRYDALALHADAAEMTTVIRGARGRLFGLGLAVAPLSFVPLLNLVAPLYAGIAFTYLCLDELAAQRVRGGAGGGSPPG